MYASSNNESHSKGASGKLPNSVLWLFTKDTAPAMTLSVSDRQRPTSSLHLSPHSLSFFFLEISSPI